MIQLGQIVRKRLMLLRGMLRTYIWCNGFPYDPSHWWDEEFYIQGVSDRHTLGNDKNILAAMYHYASVEQLILRYFFNQHIDPRGMAILDVGTGSGHWIDFYSALGAGKLTGIDISQKSIEFLQTKYTLNDAINIYQGFFQDYLKDKNNEFDLVNAIGVMFHVVNDNDWQYGLQAIANALKPGGYLIVGGHFGIINNNTRFNPDNSYRKRLRSRRYWTSHLRELNFTEIKVYRNPAYRTIRTWIPENNVLVAKLNNL